MCEHNRLLLPKETDTTDFKTIGSENAASTTTTTEETTTDLSTVVNSDNLTESLEQQQQQPQIQHNNVNINNCVAAVPSEHDSPKFDQYILDTITSVASSSSTSITSSSGYQNFCNNGATNSQNTNNDPHEMPQLLNILNELLDGQDLTSLANSGGNGDNMHDMEDQEENYEDDSPRKDDPEEMAKILSQQKLEEISREEQQLRRRMDFLIRRLFKLVARSTGLHVSEEMAGFLEHIARYSKKKEIKEKSSTMTLSSLASSPTKFPYLTANLQGTTDLLTSPTFSTEPPLNLLSSPMTAVKTQDDKQSLPQQTTNNININNNSSNNNNNTAATTHDVIEPSNELLLKPVPIKEMKSFLRRIDNISTMQSTVLTKKALAFKYFSKSSSQTSNTSNLNLTSSLNKSESNFCVSAIPKLEDADIDQVEQTSGLLMSEMRLIENQIDSDVTASSTGGESADEMTIYNNNFQQPLSISKRAAYKYSKDRGAVASRWCWLATQISELDYKIRQHTDLRKHIRENKGVVILEPVTSHENQRISGASTSYNVDSDTEDVDGGSSARVRPLANLLFRKRKLVQIANLHHISKKAARPSTLKCSCNWPLQPCALCTARIDPTAPRELTDVLPETERVALLDPCFHPVLSFQEDVSSSIHLEAIMNIPEWQSKMIRSSPKSIMKHATKQLEMLSGGNGGFKDDFKLFGLAKPNAFEINEKKLKKGNIDAITGKRKYTKRFLKMEGGPLSNKLKGERKKYKKRRASLGMAQNSHIPRKYTFKKRLRKVDGMSNSVQNQPPNGLNNNDKYLEPVNRSKNSSPVPINSRSENRTTSESRRSRNYNIDNIVIPYSVAAATRIELLSYKEIPTPKWRIVTNEDDEEQLIEEEEECREEGETHSEDISDETITLIHEKALLEERKKFETYLKFPLTSRSRANRRIDSRGNESSGTNTPTPDQTSPPHDIESIPPSPLDNTVFHDTPSITAILNNFNGRKERKRTVSKKDEVHDGGGYSSGVPSRCISPEIVKETIPAYEPLHFPLSDVSLHRLKRIMPNEHLKHNNNDNNKYYKPVMKDEEASQHHNTQQNLTTSIKHTTRPQKKRKHNDSISESILIREKLPSSSLATIGKNNNLLIPRNNHNILNSIDLKGTDGAALKKLMNNNNGDLMNGDSYNDDDEDEDDDNSDSETITGDESLFEPDEEEETDSDEYIDDEMEMDGKITYNNKKKSSMISTLD